MKLQNNLVLLVVVKLRRYSKMLQMIDYVLNHVDKIIKEITMYGIKLQVKIIVHNTHNVE